MYFGKVPKQVSKDMTDEVLFLNKHWYILDEFCLKMYTFYFFKLGFIEILKKKKKIGSEYYFG